MNQSSDGPWTVLLVVEREKKGQVLVIENLLFGLSIGYKQGQIRVGLKMTWIWKCVAQE